MQVAGRYCDAIMETLINVVSSTFSVVTWLQTSTIIAEILLLINTGAPPTSRPTTASHPPPSSSAPPSQQQDHSFPESSIQQVMAAGFSRAEAVEELRRCDGNAALALTALLARSITF